MKPKKQISEEMKEAPKAVEKEAKEKMKAKLKKLTREWLRRSKFYLKRSRKYQQSDILFAYNDGRRIGYESCAKEIIDIINDL